MLEYLFLFRADEPFYSSEHSNNRGGKCGVARPLFSLLTTCGATTTSAAFRVLRVIIVTEWNELQRAGLYSHSAIDQLLFQCLFPSSSVCFVPTPSRVFFTADTYHRPRAARQTASQHTLAFIKVNVGFCFGLRGDGSTGGRQASSFLLVAFWLAAYVSCNCSEIR